MATLQKPVIVIDDTRTGDSSSSVGGVSDTNFFDFKGNWTKVKVASPGAMNDFGAFGDTVHVSGRDPEVQLVFNGVSAQIFASLVNCINTTTCSSSFSLDGGGLGFRGLAGSQTSDVMIDNTGNVPGGNHFEQFFLQDAGASIDYALVTPSFNSPFPAWPNPLLFVNHSDATILFDGKWNESPDGRSRNSITPGDHIYFSFAGTTLTILGIIDGSLDGNVTMGLKVDSRSELQTVLYSNHFKDNYNPYFNLTGLEDYPVHNATLRVIEVTGAQALNFRGFTYTPNFASLADMPPLTPASSIKEQASQSSNHTSVPTATPASTRVSGGMIAGVVVGSIVGLGLLALFGFLLIRRRNRRDSTKLPKHPENVTTPFLEAYASSNASELKSSTTSINDNRSSTTTPYGTPSKRSMMISTSSSANGSTLHVPIPSPNPSPLPPRTPSSALFPSTTSESTASASVPGQGQTSSSIRSGSTRESAPQEMTPQMMEVIDRLVTERVDAYNRPPEYEG